MKSAIFTVLLLVTLAYSLPSIERPWKDYTWLGNNSYIVTAGGYEMWDANALDGTLGELMLEEVTGLDYPDDAGKVRSALEEAREARQEALREKQECNEETTIAVVIHLLGTAAYPQWGGLSVLHNYLLINRVFHPSEVPSCGEYGTHWTATMDAATDALEDSVWMYEKERGRNESWEELLDAGVCDPAYTGAARNTCRALEIQQQELEEQEAELEEAFQEVRSGLWQRRPVGTPWVRTMEMLWKDGLLVRTRLFHMDAAETLRNADAEYLTLRTESEQIQRDTADAMERLQEERLELIAASPFILGSVETGQEHEVAGAWEALQEKKKSAEERMQIAGITYGRKGKGHLKNATQMLYAMQEEYARIDMEIPRVEQDARAVREEMRTVAQQEIEELQQMQSERDIGDEAERKLRDAEEYFQIGESARALGIAYQNYREAAKAARMGTGMAAGYSLEEDAAQQGYEQQIADLLQRAEQDGLEVSLERMEFRLARGKKEPWALETMEQIGQEVLEKAQYAFHGLEERRAEVRALLAVSPEFDDIERELDEKEGDAFFANGKINYEKALGSLRGLEAAYYLAEQQALEQRDVIVRERMEKEVSVRIGKARLDEPSSMALHILLYNPTGLSVPEMHLELAVPRVMELSMADGTGGSETVKNIEQRGDTLTLDLQEVSARTPYVLHWEKERILARSLERRIRTTGKPDGSAEIEERVTFELVHPDSLEMDGAATIDGFSYHGRELEKGEHTLERRYENAQAFTQETGNYRSTDMGITARVEYDLWVQPAMDMESLEIWLPQGNDSVQEFRVVSATGERIENKRFLGNGLYALELRNVRANRTAQIHVTLDVRDAKGYAERRLALLTTENQSEGVRTLLDEAQMLMQQNKSEEALAKIEQAAGLLEKERRETDKQEKEYSVLRRQKEREIDEITETLRITNLSHPFLQKLQERKNVIEETLEGRPNETVTERIERLKTMDANWEKKEIAQLLKESWDSYNQLQEELAGEGGMNATIANKVEGSLRRLEVSGALTDTPALLESMRDAQEYADQKRAEQENEWQKKRQAFAELKGRFQESAERYANQQREARGSAWEGWFKVDSDRVERTLREAEASLKKGAWNEFEAQLKELEQAETTMGETLDRLKKETGRKQTTAQQMYAARQQTLSSGDRERMEEQLARMQSLAEQGRYVQALKVYESFLKGLPDAQEEENAPLLVLGITTALILALLIGYMVQQMKKPDGERDGGRGGGNKGGGGWLGERTKLKRLKRAGEEPD